MKPIVWKLVLTVCLCVLVVSGGDGTAVFANQPPANSAPPDGNFAYGAFTLARRGTQLIPEMCFGWAKMYHIPYETKAIKVLWRVPATGTDAQNSLLFADLLKQQVIRWGHRIEAYEIGNEVNLGQNGWEMPPNAADYAQLLCHAYTAIKEVNPDALVVSAGLAPVGRITGNWNGQAGHNGEVQDERAYLQAFINAGGANCADAIGYHPMGFSADFNADPDINGGTPETNCHNGFCFRGMEKIYDILVANGYGHKKIWATEVGWLRTPPSHCYSHPSWEGREWQVVSAEKQAQNLYGAFRYARANWPWLEAMFVFNYDFDRTHYYDGCEQMRYYAIREMPAEAALKSLHYPFTHHLPLLKSS